MGMGVLGTDVASRLIGLGFDVGRVEPGRPSSWPP
jgi:phosphoglycerate dehydrogenase-like enzyme